MKIKRFTAKDMRTAIRDVRDDQGPDAVILSTRQIEGGVEVIAAIDYDEALVSGVLNGPEETAAPVAPESPPITADSPSPFATAARDIEWSQDPALKSMREELMAMRELLESQLSSLAWNDRTRRRPFEARMLKNLATLGLAPELVKELGARAGQPADASDAWRLPLATLKDHVPTVDVETFQRGVVAVVGPTGVGKTTTIAKLASRYAMREGPRSLGLVSMDNFRIGAREQLRTFAQILGVPVHAAGDANEFRRALNVLADKPLTLVDTAGMAPRDARLASQLAALRAEGTHVRVLLTLPANAQVEALEEAVDAFAALDPDAVIVTKIDEAASLGGVLSVLMRRRLPVAWLADGQRVPEDLHAAQSRRAWLVRTAVELARRRGVSLDEEFMAEHFGEKDAHAYA